MKPTQSTFGDPTEDTQSTAMLRVALGKVWFDVAAMQGIAMRLRIISTIRVNVVRTFLRMTHLPRNRRNAFQDGQQLGDVVAIGGSESNVERNPVGIRDDMMLAARFSSVGGIRPRFFPTPQRPQR